LIIGFGFSIIAFIRRILSGNKLQIENHWSAHSLLYLWVFSLLLAYAYYYYTSAFYIDYSREFLPPLVILFSAWLIHAVPALNRDEIMERFVIGGFCLSIIVFFITPHFKELIGEGIIVCLTLALFTIAYFLSEFKSRSRRIAFLLALAAGTLVILFSRQAPLASFLSGPASKLAIIVVIFIVPWIFFTKNVRPTIKEYLRFISFSVVLSAFALSLFYSANRITLAYDSRWSPRAVEKTAAYLKKYTRTTDTVMSGAAIWELQALRRPFLGISHPLIFEHKIPVKYRQRLEAPKNVKLPEIIILDGYTEKTYLRQLPWLRDQLNSEYKKVFTAEPARRPVQVYQQKNSL
jgi:hypothetical protein